MSLIIGGISVTPSRVIEQSTLDKIADAQSADEIENIDSWVVRKMDWVTGSKRAQVYKALYVLTNKEYLKKDAPEKVMEQAKALYLLSRMTQGAKEPVTVKLHTMRLPNSEEGDNSSFQLAYKIPGLRGSDDHTSFLTEPFGYRELNGYFSDTISAAKVRQRFPTSPADFLSLPQEQRTAANAAVTDLTNKSKLFTDKCHQLATLEYLPQGKHEPEWTKEFNSAVKTSVLGGQAYLPFGQQAKMQRGPYNVFWDTATYRLQEQRWNRIEHHESMFGLFHSSGITGMIIREVPVRDPNGTKYLIPTLRPIAPRVVTYLSERVLDR
ncbi:hypothetical protein D5018_08355 [Parashewanella curva]|uniref:Uncharacterized protein n=2 Tax=Parashewanella curva TaxID=2338552 RepID=A0A3L8PXF0_9GAMM|nr:hypothetical protein D5018_08355 [Parashewanella curva]